MSINLNSMSAKELSSLITQANKRKTTLKKRKPVGTVRRRLTQQAKKEGYTIAELFGSGAAATAARARTPAKKRNTGGKVAPKYRDPAEYNNTWTGRGKQPRWLAAYTDNGRNKDEFLINK